jgi:hypothetical protein
MHEGNIEHFNAIRGILIPQHLLGHHIRTRVRHHTNVSCFINGWAGYRCVCWLGGISVPHQNAQILKVFTKPMIMLYVGVTKAPETFYRWLPSTKEQRMKNRRRREKRIWSSEAMFSGHNTFIYFGMLCVPHTSVWWATSHLFSSKQWDITFIFS